MRFFLCLASAVSLSGCVYSDYDKALHFAAGSVAQNYVTQQTGSRLAGCVTAVGLGFAKEAFDSRTGGQVDSGDVLATAAGCTITFEW